MAPQSVLHALATDPFVNIREQQVIARRELLKWLNMNVRTVRLPTTVNRSLITLFSVVESSSVCCNANELRVNASPFRRAVSSKGGIGLTYHVSFTL